MSSQTQRKKTLAQLRAEKEQRERDLELGWQLASEVTNANYERINSWGGDSVGDPAYYEELKTLLAKANRACELLRHDPDRRAYRRVQYDIARLYLALGQHTSASTVLKETDDLYEVAERKGSLTTVETRSWANIVM